MKALNLDFTDPSELPEDIVGTLSEEAYPLDVYVSDMNDLTEGLEGHQYKSSEEGD